MKLVLGEYRAAKRPLIEKHRSGRPGHRHQPGARANLTTMFAFNRRLDLTGKVLVIPYPVDDEFLLGDMSTSSRPGRPGGCHRCAGTTPRKTPHCWLPGSSKRPALCPETEFVLIGQNGGETLASVLCERVARVKYLGVQLQSVIAKFLRESPAFVLSSRWESSPICGVRSPLRGVLPGWAVVGPDDPLVLWRRTIWELIRPAVGLRSGRRSGGRARRVVGVHRCSSSCFAEVFAASTDTTGRPLVFQATVPGLYPLRAA